MADVGDGENIADGAAKAASEGSVMKECTGAVERTQSYSLHVRQ